MNIEQFSTVQIVTAHMEPYLATLDAIAVKEYNYTVAQYDCQLVWPFVQYVVEHDAQFGQYLITHFNEYADFEDGDEWDEYFDEYADFNDGDKWGEYFNGTEREVNCHAINKFIDYLFIMAPVFTK